jgi:hypothetical protein
LCIDHRLSWQKDQESRVRTPFVFQDKEGTLFESTLCLLRIQALAKNKIVGAVLQTLAYKCLESSWSRLTLNSMGFAMRVS